MDYEKEVAFLISSLYSETPTKNKIENWLSYFSEKEYPKHTSDGGKWLIFCSEENVDKTWLKIKKAQDKKLLGDSSKVATKINAERYKGSYVICVYTYDYKDKEDVLRVRENLFKLGFTEKLHYKRDKETRENIYGGSNEFYLTI